MARCSALTSQPESMNVVASQSSSSGWLGYSPCSPKFSDVLTRPVPKYLCQKRFHRHAGGERVVGLDEPAGEPQTIVRRIVRHRGQHRRHAGIHPLARHVVGAANQPERVAPGFHLLHHHDGWEAVPERRALALEVLDVLPRLLHLRRRVLVEEGEPQLLGLPGRPAGRHHPGDLGQRLPGRHDGRLLRRQGLHVDAHVIDHSLEPGHRIGGAGVLRSGPAGPDAQRLPRSHRVV